MIVSHELRIDKLNIGTVDMVQPTPGRTTGTDGVAAVRYERALADLHEHAAGLAARDTPPAKLLHEMIRRHALHQLDIGRPLPPVLPLVREVLGMPDWDPLADWSEDVRAGGPALAEGIVSDEEEIRERAWRARVTSLWLFRHAGEDIAERVVQAAEDIALAAVEGGAA